MVNSSYAKPLCLTSINDSKNILGIYLTLNHKTLNKSKKPVLKTFL